MAGILVAVVQAAESVRNGLERMLGDCDDVESVVAAASLVAIAFLLGARRPGIWLIDTAATPADVATIKSLTPSARVIATLRSEEQAEIAAAVWLGVDSYILDKPCSHLVFSNELSDAIAGRVLLPQVVYDYLRRPGYARIRNGRLLDRAARRPLTRLRSSRLVGSVRPQPVALALGPGLDDVGVEGETVDKWRLRTGGRGGPHSLNGRLLPWRWTPSPPARSRSGRAARRPVGSSSK